MRVRVPPPALQLVVVRNVAHRTPATTRHYRYGSPILDTHHLSGVLEFWNSGHGILDTHELGHSSSRDSPILDTHEVSRRRVPIHHHESGGSRILIWGRRGCLKQDPWRRWVLNCSDATGNDNFWHCRVVTYVGTVSRSHRVACVWRYKVTVGTGLCGQRRGHERETVRAKTT